LTYPGHSNLERVFIPQPSGICGAHCDVGVVALDVNRINIQQEVSTIAFSTNHQFNMVNGMREHASQESGEIGSFGYLF
jgi:hypothetical protein